MRNRVVCQEQIERLSAAGVVISGDGHSQVPSQHVQHVYKIIQL